MSSTREDYDVISFGPPDADWRPDDVGLDRSAAIANLAKRVIYHCDWQGVALLERILDGDADPEEPQYLEETTQAPERWFRIAAAGTRPPLPGS